MHWDDLRFFLALARRGSVRAAGADLGVSHTTVLRRVAALEEQLGSRLFDRHRDGFSLTDAGRRLVPSAERVEDQVCALSREVAGRDQALSGRVRVTCCDDWIGRFVLTELRPWCEANPGVDLALGTDARPFNLAKGEADLAIRAISREVSPPEPLVARKLGPIVCANYGAAHRAHAPRWLAFDDSRIMSELVRGSSHPSMPVWGEFSTLAVMIAAAAEGLGIAVLPTYVGDAEPSVTRLDPFDPRHVADLWLLVHPDLRENSRVSAVRAVIRDAFAREAARFDGSVRAPHRSIDAP